MCQFRADKYRAALAFAAGKAHKQQPGQCLQALLRKECGLELAVGPAQLATSAYWTLRGASAFVAGKLGTTVTHVLQQHSMLHMTKASADMPLPIRKAHARNAYSRH